jgi:UDP-N-acetylglucosamine--N-acetylmuramyl-(pentapeptide) pyrophosphoryl-undecaprenol N-acetylglucosamine transferase
MKIAVACGGTGGHAIPGAVAAHALRARGHAVTVWLAGRGAESSIAELWDGPVVRVSVRSIGSLRSPAALLGVCSQFSAVVRAIRKLRADRPAVLLAMGSYTSVPPVIAARLLRIPVVLHEANAIPGLAIACLARLASRVAMTFASAAKHLPAGRVVVTGLPLRRLATVPLQHEHLSKDRFTVMVMGGSQGAHALNETVTGALCRLHASCRAIQVVHLSGSADMAAVRASYAQAGVPAVVFDFFVDIGRAYRAADVVVARAGAATCMELAAVAVPAVLVPLPTAARNHQVLNARYLERAGGAVVIEQAELTVAGLATRLAGLMDAPDTLRGMRAAMRDLQATDGAERLADVTINAGKGGTAHADL